MEFRNLYSFLRVAELGSFTKAAAELGYAQSTVTTHIQQLEQELNRPLFEHFGRRVVLTTYGSQLIPYVNKILSLQEQMQSLNHASSAQVFGSVRVGIVESIMYSILLENFGEYRTRFPNVSMQIEMDVTAPLLEKLKNGEVDLIFTLGNEKEIPGCVHAGNYPVRAVFIAAIDHPLTKKDDVRLADVLREPLILTGTHTVIRQELDHAARLQGLEVNPFLETVSNGFIFALVRQNMGISFLPEYRIRKAAQEHEIAILPVSDFQLELYVNIYYHKNKYVTPQMAGLIHLVQEYWDQVSAEKYMQTKEDL